MDIFGTSRRNLNVERESVLAAIDRSQARIEFTLDGHVVTANANFLSVMGYDLAEIVGQHHRLFVPPEHADTPAYSAFWERLRRGEYQSAEFRRIGKGGREIWIQASYNPILDASGKPVKVVKFATDITAQKLFNLDAAGQLAALSKAQAVIEFSVDGTVLTANENFCTALGYDLSEIEGRHHRMFVSPEDVASPAYKAFWTKLGQGYFQSAEYLRIGKGGRRVWIQATYNPILDASGKVFKVVKFATDITSRKHAIETLGESLAHLAEGNLTKTIAEPFEGDLDQVRLALNQSIEKFATIVGQLRQTSRSLKTATGEILAGANDLAERTTRQAATIEETSAAMEQLASTVVENARRADSASLAARAVSKTASESGGVMHQATEAMERISESSGKISNIIGLIDDIAFQTNLLALNASVEAARAGDAGKGFAVVAVEVRRLAQSAAKASSDVKALIEQSANEVKSGSKLVSEAAGRLAQMVEGATTNAAIIDGIAQASQEQSNAINEVSVAVRQMDEITQHNAALVEETNAAIEQTEGQARELDYIVDTLIIEDQPTDVRRVVTTPSQRVPSIRSSPTRPRAYPSQGNAAMAQDWNEF